MNPSPRCGAVTKASVRWQTARAPDAKSILRRSRKEMERRLPDIVAFAELEHFIDAPLRTYSTGMMARLGFAVATDVDPEVLLVDEVLAVGDIEFQERCMDRIRTFLQGGSTLVVVSHSPPAVVQLCERVVWLDAGRVMRGWSGGRRGAGVRRVLDPRAPVLGYRLSAPRPTTRAGTSAVRRQRGRRPPSPRRQFKNPDWRSCATASWPTVAHTSAPPSPVIRTAVISARSPDLSIARDTTLPHGTRVPPPGSRAYNGLRQVPAVQRTPAAFAATKGAPHAPFEPAVTSRLRYRSLTKFGLPHGTPHTGTRYW